MSEDHFLRLLRRGVGADARTLLSLARAVRSLDGPSFHLDLDIALAYGLTKHETGQSIVYSGGRGGGDPLTAWVLPNGVTITTVRGAAPEFTGRLDLAMSLVPDDWRVVLIRNGSFRSCEITGPDQMKRYGCAARSLELAVVSAALTMRGTLMGGAEG